MNKKELYKTVIDAIAELQKEKLIKAIDEATTLIKARGEEKHARRAAAAKEHGKTFNPKNNWGLDDPKRGHHFGINHQSTRHAPGTSVVGGHLRDKADPVIPLKEQRQDNVKHLKEAPKPNLPKSEPMQKDSVVLGKPLTSEGGSVTSGKQRMHNEKGVHPAVSRVVQHASVMGLHQRSGHKDTSQDMALSKLKELQQMPKPNLPKSEDMEKNKQWPHNHVKGVHQAADETDQGESPAGIESRYIKETPPGPYQDAHKETALRRHKRVLDENRRMPNPNLPKSEPMQKKYEGFKAVEEHAKESGARDPGAVAAAIGRKKYGKEAFQHAAAAGKKMGKAENPDAKADAKLGEAVEHLCEEHFKENASAERKEGHKLVAKSECAKCKSMQKAEPLGKPYVSDAQRKKFHAMENRGEISHATVHEWDEASKGKKLPEHVKKADPVTDLPGNLISKASSAPAPAPMPPPPTNSMPKLKQLKQPTMKMPSRRPAELAHSEMNKDESDSMVAPALMVNEDKHKPFKDYMQKCMLNKAWAGKAEPHSGPSPYAPAPSDNGHGKDLNQEIAGVKAKENSKEMKDSSKTLNYQEKGK